MDNPVLTSDDIIRSGACFEGVQRVVRRLDKKLPAAIAINDLLPLLRGAEKEYAIKAGCLDGSGSGYGNGNGYGNGDGYGYGYGDGDGNGNGDGNGDGNGYGGI